ncbi:unnamed protein product [Leptosia nina]|uniref:Kinetochore protein NDC80 n=1 Tax=Leptosia nina TaxID=320188 RepID=A0AAV1JA56_9NEOP
MSNRYTSLSSVSAVRKSRLEGKPSLLPKPRPPGSIDRQSMDTKRPSTTGFRSSSAEPPRATIGGRLSREPSATKIPFNRRSRSQTGGGEVRHDVATPRRSNQYSTTATPVRTPSQDRDKFNWQISLDRALAFVINKDKRPIQSIDWQRSECARMNVVLASLEVGGLSRPLTIARFVEIVNILLSYISKDAKLNNDNYVVKLPHLTKRLLYPGAMPKSWLRTVNTLHSFPQALALISYLADLLSDIRRPVTDEWLYKSKDDKSRLRRAYLRKCWYRFNYQTNNGFDDLNEEYLQDFKTRVGYNELKVAELQKEVRKCEIDLERTEELDAKEREKEAVIVSRHEHLVEELHQVKNQRSELNSNAVAERARSVALASTRQQLAAEVERSKVQLEQLQKELASQTMTVQERNKLLDKLDFDRRVTDSKQALAKEVSRKLVSKENELALWQKRALDSCVQYKQALVQLAPSAPHLAALAVDETELMSPECVQHMSRAMEQLQREQEALAAKKQERARSKTQMHRRNAQLAEETRSKIAEIKAAIEREQQALELDMAAETAESASWNREELSLQQRADDLRAGHHQYNEVEEQLRLVREREVKQRERVSHMKALVEDARAQSAAALLRAREKRRRLLKESVQAIRERLQH